MCGRYTLSSPGEAIAAALGMTDGPPAEGLAAARYNIAPTQRLPIVRRGARMPREWAVAAWGFDGHLINARAETVNRQPSFRAAFRARRCLVPADGFFEWLKDGRHRQGYYIRRRDRRPFAFAGLWEADAYTILTCPPNELVATIHDRMPVVLPKAGHETWLEGDAKAALSLLAPAPAQDWEAYPVGRAVHSPVHDAPDCIAPLASPGTLILPPRQGSLFP